MRALVSTAAAAIIKSEGLPREIVVVVVVVVVVVG